MSHLPQNFFHLVTIEQVQENLITYFRLFAGLPGITHTEADVTWFVSTRGLPGNHVLRTDLSDTSADRRIDEVISEIGQQADQFDWFVFPNCRPADLGARLAARGAAGGPDGTWQLAGQVGGPGGTWMIADLAMRSAPPPVPPGFHIKPVQDRGMLREWQQISVKGFGSKDDYQIFYDVYARHGFGPEAQALHFIGYLADEPVTSSTLLLAGGSASVYNVSTPEALRRQGFGGAITYAALEAAQARGYRSAWIWSSALGRGVYRKLGFAVTDFGIREYQWQRR